MTAFGQTLDLGRLRRQQSILLLLAIFTVLLIAGVTSVSGFTSKTSVISILVLSAFLGVAAIGQTLVALVGGIDVSIPFVMTCANIGLIKLISVGWAPLPAIVAVLVAAAAVGVLNGVLSWTLGVHPLLITLGVGFAALGGVEIWFANAQSGAPGWLTQLSSAGSDTLGVPVPPVVVIWAVLAIVVVLVLRETIAGRHVYASGDSPVAADRMHVRRRLVWIALFGISGVMAAVAGIMLLGFTGGGDTTVGDPYMLSTIAAVVVGGTTLLGGVGGYGRTVLGALLLGVLNTLLVGYGVDPKLQQAVLGLIIVAMVALYARESHPRNSI